MRLLFLPGLAADGDLFAEQLRALGPSFPGSKVLPWIKPNRGERLEAYCERLAATIDAGRPFAFVGFSFGGMVAQEMAKHLRPRPRAIALVCGVRGRHQFTGEFARNELLGRLTPGFAQRLAYRPFAKQFAKRCGLDEQQARRLGDMAARNDPAFFKWSGKACAKWCAEPSVPPEVRVRHIHGELDDVIPDVRSEADVTIVGGHHLITWTHAAEVSAFIRETVA
ncbi:MAG: alpha/beta hydrolase [Planctomycetota bacterium]